MTKILIDLDGTLLDASDRLYGLFCALVCECTLDKNTYWNLKRAKVGHHEILRQYYGYTNEAVAAFESAWMQRIETHEWLTKDKLHSGVKPHLRMLAEAADLYLLTARQSSEMVDFQLQSMGIKDVFREIFVTGGNRPKENLLAHLPLSASDWIIGDTGHDIEVGRRLGVKTACVCNGFLSRESLLPYAADSVLESFTDFHCKSSKPS